ncbi:MAG: acetoacetate--CoA ligase [Geminicoccaceae bacterium]
MTSRLWQPTEERIAASQMAAFAKRFGEEIGETLADYPALWQASIDDKERFWSLVWEIGKVKASQNYEKVLVAGSSMRDAKWFPGARLNFAENLLRRDDDGPALVGYGEDGERRVWSWAKLSADVARLVKVMRDRGIGTGDRVAAMVPNIPETIIAMLATSAVGATWSSCSPDFGTRGVLDRFGQIEPKLLISVDGYRYAGKELDIRDKLAEIVGGLETVQSVILVPFLNRDADAGPVPKAAMWSDVLPSEVPDLSFEQLPFDHPLYILYSSGTTGVPKAIIHSAGGTLIQHIKEHRLHGDLKRDDRLFYFTTCGWMMWNWLVSGLACEATLILFDGSPFHPKPDVLFDIAQSEGITTFGTSAKYIDALKKEGLRPIDSHDLSALRAILSTGSPLLPESFDYVYDAIKPDLLLGSISGGTDIVSCFVLCNPIQPVHKGEIQCRGLGMAVEIWDDDGKPVREQKGELVCTAPFPAMPIGFWNDEDGSRYRDAYFERYGTIWCHGDYAELTGHDGVIIHGRSDAVLNPGGVRIGTAEIYRQVEQIDEVVESLCIGQEWEGDVRVVLFVRLREGIELDDELTKKIRTQIRSNATPRHVPAKVVQVTDIPRTLSGKIVELAARDVVHGREVKNVSALANPEALEQFRDRPELR